MNTLQNNEFDEQFNNVENLKWLPWVGEDYCNIPSEKKLLIVGESHYLPSKDEPWYEEVKKREFTRNFVFKQINNPNNDMEKILINTQRVLYNCEPTVDQKYKLWNSVSYYNFVQRELESVMHRPVKVDYEKGWRSFFKIVNILNPALCLFCGVSASDYNGVMKEEAEKNGYTHVRANSLMNKIGRVSPRKISIFQNEKEITILFIQHPSRGFIFSDWSQFVQHNMKDYTEWLGSVKNINA